MEIDHILICSKNRAVVADTLINAGFTEGAGNTHPGQGTSNRRFFFHNAYIEFLYQQENPQLIDNQDKLDILKRLNCPDGSCSPFGVGFRPSELNEKARFPTWRYKPPYLPDNYEINVGEAPVNEPLWFFLNFSCRPDRLPSAKQPPLRHQCGVSELTSVTLTVKEDAPLSPTTQNIIASGIVSLEFGSNPFLTLVFDHNQQNKRISLLPELPLTIHY
ncbi:VOC family protein [Brenneria sp. g21c3]|uniref:VOC family protein n=1 Tax=Brenneria sp. g21c3 TaxID=3093893 RepID=UPI002E9F4DF7|nr:VOC family protein [Brenneria sp. g21c3]